MTRVDEDQDFEDFDTVTDETVVNDDVMDDATDDDTDAAYASANQAARKKRQTVFYLILFLMIFLGGISAWFVFFRTSDADDTATIVPLASTAAPAEQTTSATTPSANPAAMPETGQAITALPPGVITPQDMVNAATAVAPEIPAAAPAPVTADSDDMPVASAPVDGTLAEALPPPASPATAEAPQAITPMTPVEPSAAPAVMPPTGETPMVAMPATTPVAVTPVVPVAVVDNTSNEQRFGQMEQQIQQLTSELNAAKAGLSSAPTPKANGDTGLAAQLSAVNDKLDRVTKQVDDLDQRTTSFAAELQNRANSPATATAPKMATQKTTVIARKVKTPVKTAATDTPKWELRSATPGAAWLGKLGSEEMARFNVGQTVPGLGVVQEVTQEGNRWVVKTSGGTLRQ